MVSGLAWCVIRRAGAHESDINSALRMSTDGKKVEPFGGFSDVSHLDESVLGRCHLRPHLFIKLGSSSFMYRLSSLVRTTLIKNNSKPAAIRSCRYYTAMADNNGAKTPGERPAVDKKAKANDLKEVKILMLHGKLYDLLVYPD